MQKGVKKYLIRQHNTCQDIVYFIANLSINPTTERQEGLSRFPTQEANNVVPLMAHHVAILHLTSPALPAIPVGRTQSPGISSAILIATGARCIDSLCSTTTVGSVTLPAVTSIEVYSSSVPRAMLGLACPVHVDATKDIIGCRWVDKQAEAEKLCEGGDGNHVDRCETG